MELVKVGHAPATMPDAAPSELVLNDREVRLADVSTTRVSIESVASTILAVGTLVVPEPQKSIVSARFGGRIEKVYADAPGVVVRAGDRVFDIYSPELVQAEHEYLQSHGPASSTSQEGPTAPGARLRLMGLTDAQIRRLDSTGIVPFVSTYYSSSRGTVMDKKIVQGSYVSEGQELYDLADLSTLWNIADVPISEGGEVRLGDKATISFPSVRMETVTGRVVFVSPVVDAQSRTVKVRLVVGNAAGKLKPNMYTEARFSVLRRNAVVVPVSAVLMTGKRAIVYVKNGGGNRFAAREIGLGQRFRDRYEVQWGLSEGEEIVSEGGFLIDSESQLRAGGGSEHQHE